ncbi:lipopolysaccharide biosynthesis protein [Butyricimonas faecihominis]|uniref:lipopolysaccharide biosynthesis protein n=1 Tax=Butyricimonas faecihominis TaxID=1472416 RepID=UPI00267064E2|nr:lipopolysaccharide biosynthesis protein [Butyricimonas faecihominis]
MATIKNQASHSVFWSAVERFSTQGVQFVLGMIIARFLLPSDYGTIAMLSIFMAIAQTFIDGGFINALIQKKQCSQQDYSTVFFFNICMSIGLYSILYLCAPWIANFYNEKLLTQVMRVIGLTLIINSLGIVQQAKLTIELNFKQQAIASFIAVLISGIVGVILAYQGFGVWTLVIQSLTSNLLRVILLWIFAHWKPLPYFSKNSFTTMFSFGSRLLLSSLLHTIYTNLYSLVIGKRFAPIELGLYNRATTIAQFPSNNLATVIVRAIYPIQCRIQDDTPALKELFIKYLRMSCYIIFPLMTILCVLAEPLVKIILTEKWLPAVPLIQILCLAYMWDPIMKINNSLLNVKGRSDYFLYAEIIKKIVALIILIVTLQFNVQIMCLGLILYALADMLIISLYVRKTINITIKEQIKALFPILMLSVILGLVSHIAIILTNNPWIQLLGGFTTGSITYLGISHYLNLNELNTLLHFKL